MIPNIIFTRSIYYPKLVKVFRCDCKKFSRTSLALWVGLALLIQINMFTCTVMICFMHMNANKSRQQMLRRIISRFVASKTRHLKAQLAIEFREVSTAVLPGSLTFSSRSSMLSTSCSLGEWSTTTVDPNTHIALPTFPSRLRRSFKNRDDKTSLKWKQIDEFTKCLKIYTKPNHAYQTIQRQIWTLPWQTLLPLACLSAFGFFFSSIQNWKYIPFLLQSTGKENILRGYCNDILNRFMPFNSRWSKVLVILFWSIIGKLRMLKISDEHPFFSNQWTNQIKQTISLFSQKETKDELP